MSADSLTLLLRLSDEQTWSSAPFQASSPTELMNGCIEAFANLRAEWPFIGAARIPAHQTLKRAAHDATRPQWLYVQVCYHGEWSVVPPVTPKIREPGTAVGTDRSFVDEDWGDAWDRCRKTFLHVQKLSAFAHWASKP